MSDTNLNERDHEVDGGTLYTPPEVAQDEIRRRWQDARLKEAVLSFLEGQLPPFLGDLPSALLWRHIASPNLECAHFLKLAEDVQLRPLCLQFTADKFVTRNPDKYRLAKMHFHGGKATDKGHAIETTKVIDIDAAHGKRLDEIMTLWGEPFVAFHHRLFLEHFPSLRCDCDLSSWIRLWGPIEAGYTRLFALLTCFAVIFDNYSLSGHEAEFTANVVLPAFRATVERFNVKP